MTKPHFWDEATRELGARDPILSRLIAAFPGLHLTRRGDPFTTLARSIVGQQISVRAAQTVWDRLAAACTERKRSGARRAGIGRVPASGPGRLDPERAPASGPAPLDPERVQRKRIATLRACGLSANKATYIRDLARHFTSARLDPTLWPQLDDESLITALIDVKGIGRWTAEMFLMFHELRANVLPVGDLGLQKAVAIQYFDGERPTPAQIREVGEAWQPWRSVATWYLWRSLEPVPVEY
jgi:DNA-3-methyladenine glycosylase II